MILLFLTPPFHFTCSLTKKSSLKFIPTDQIGEKDLFQTH